MQHMKQNLIFIVIIGLLFAYCGSPFLPVTGVPPEQPVDLHMRSTPEGIIKQLIESYETRSIELFTDLFPDDSSFQFFIAPDYFSAIDINKYDYEERDQRLMHLADNKYYYWTQTREIDKHRRLFDYIDEIEFVSEPTLEVRVFTDNGERMAEVLATSGEMEVSDNQGSRIVIYRVKIEKQVFLMQKDADNLWVIRKWYDFSREGA
jgi:hypothetical protein